MQNFELIKDSQTNTFRNNEFTQWCFLNGAFFKTTLVWKWSTPLTSSQSSHFYSQKTNLRQRRSVMRPQEDAKCSVSRYMREMCNPKATPAVSSLLEKAGKPPKQGYPEDTLIRLTNHHSGTTIWSKTHLGSSGHNTPGIYSPCNTGGAAKVSPLHLSTSPWLSSTLCAGDLGDNPTSTGLQLNANLQQDQD